MAKVVIKLPVTLADGCSVAVCVDGISVEVTTWSVVPSKTVRELSDKVDLAIEAPPDADADTVCAVAPVC